MSMIRKTPAEKEPLAKRLAERLRNEAEVAISKLAERLGTEPDKSIVEDGYGAKFKALDTYIQFHALRNKQKREDPTSPVYLTRAENIDQLRESLEQTLYFLGAYWKTQYKENGVGLRINWAIDRRNRLNDRSSILLQDCSEMDVTEAAQAHYKVINNAAKARIAMYQKAVGTVSSAKEDSIVNAVVQQWHEKIERKNRQDKVHTFGKGTSKQVIRALYEICNDSDPLDKVLKHALKRRGNPAFIQILPEFNERNGSSCFPDLTEKPVTVMLIKSIPRKHLVSPCVVSTHGPTN